jgi:hypothetical protein
MGCGRRRLFVVRLFVFLCLGGFLLSSRASSNAVSRDCIRDSTARAGSARLISQDFILSIERERLAVGTLLRCSLD